MKRLLALVAITACGSSQHATSASDDRYVLTAKRLYIAPDAPPIDDAWIEVSGGTIMAIGHGAAPVGVRRDDACSGGVISAGFQNSHVHFIADSFSRAAQKPAVALQAALTELTTKYGFTTVVDTGSNPADTFAVRERIARGELRGPTILTAGSPIYPDHGIPLYLRDLPPEILATLLQPSTADEARVMIAKNLAAGADATKLFVATPQGEGVIKRMAPEIVQAAVEETHRLGKLVIVHPTDPDGVTAAADASVDIIAHTTIDPNPSVWSPELIAKLVAKHISVVPTLQLWGYELAKANAPKDIVEKSTREAEQQLAAFAKAGGQVLFGTDAGYMTTLDPTEEYVRLAEAGLTPMQILAALTTAPAARWGASDRRGRVAAKLAADLVVLDGDPAADVRAFSAVRCTIRAGMHVFSR